METRNTEIDPADARRLAAFDVSLRPITGSDQDLLDLHELAMGVGWPHRRDDIELLTRLGKGYIAVDDIGRPLASGLHFPVAEDVATIGMMITAPRLQTIGAGRWLLGRLMQDSGVVRFMLNSTRSGFKLYQSEGFQTCRTIYQHQGKARPIYLPYASELYETRDMTAADEAAIRRLDAKAVGFTRKAPLDWLLVPRTGRVLMENGEIAGYAVVRNFGRGKVIGPIIAGSDDMAMALIAPIIMANPGTFLRVDTPRESSEFNAFLSAAGLGAFDTVIEMHFGDWDAETLAGRSMLFGLSAHAIG